MGESIYIRMKQSCDVAPLTTIRLGQIAQMAGPKPYTSFLKDMVIHKVTKEDRNIVVIDGISIIHQIMEVASHLDIELIGPSQCVIHIDHPKKRPNPIVVSAIWLLLFIGAAMAIMNFHYDVSMEAVQQKLHYMLTGEMIEHPLWIQIPYSIGLGVGMVLFFNHWFQKKFNEEPSPMEVEVFNYQENLDHYAAIKENRAESKHVDD